MSRETKMHEEDRKFLSRVTRLHIGRRFLLGRIEKLTEEGTEESLERAVALHDWLETDGPLAWAGD